jgi:hypothetical protein
MKKLWMMITTLQVMVHMPLLSIFIPSNAVMCFSAIVDISNMNILPKEYMDKILSVFGSEKSDEEEKEESKPEGNFQ